MTSQTDAAFSDVTSLAKWMGWKKDNSFQYNFLADDSDVLLKKAKRCSPALSRMVAAIWKAMDASIGQQMKDRRLRSKLSSPLRFAPLPAPNLEPPGGTASWIGPPVLFSPQRKPQMTTFTYSHLYSRNCCP